MQKKLSHINGIIQIDRKIPVIWGNHKDGSREETLLSGLPVLYHINRPAQISESGFPPEISVRVVVVAIPQAASSVEKEP